MRMLRQFPPLSLAIPPPVHVRFLPQSTSSTSPHSQPFCNILAIASDGLIQTTSLSPSLDPILESVQAFSSSLSAGNSVDPSLPDDSVTVVCASSSGHLLCVGSAQGVISLHSNRHEPNLKVNQVCFSLSLSP
jgi:hypothetical protein